MHYSVVLITTLTTKFLFSRFVANVTDQGTSSISLSVFDWNLRIMSRLEQQDVPHRCIPQVQSGFMITLQMISLLQRDGWDFLSTSQYILGRFRSVAFLFVLMCLVHVNLLSKYIPKYFTSLTLGTGRSYRSMVRLFSFLVVNVINILTLFRLPLCAIYPAMSEYRKVVFEEFQMLFGGLGVLLIQQYYDEVSSHCTKYIRLVPARFLVALQT